MTIEKLNSIIFRLYTDECTFVMTDPTEIKWVLESVGFKFVVLKCKDHYDGSTYWQINVEDKPKQFPTVSVWTRTH